MANAAHASSVTFADIIPDAERDAFYGFEDLPSPFSGSNVVSGNISVSQVMGDVNGICTGCNSGDGEGSRGWFPSGGDFGYTVVKTSDGTDLDAIVFLSGSGMIGVTPAHYSLRRDGTEVGAGSFVNSFSMSYVGISGAIFDEVWLLSQGEPTEVFTFFGDGTANIQKIDAVEFSYAVPIPLPAGFPLLLGGLGALAFAARRKKKQA